MLPAEALAEPAAGSISVMRILNGATVLVQLVIVLLLVISVASWATLIAKLVELKRAFRQLDAAGDVLQKANSLNDISETNDVAARWLLLEARKEMSYSADLVSVGVGDATSERVALTLSRVEDQIARRISRGVAFFAMVGSVTPFVGLLGTVWGIMHSFIGIAQANSTSLAVVAPGIAEALLATAVGLFVAIPATIMYNVIGKMVTAYRSRLMDCSAAIVCMVSRDVERMRPVRGTPQVSGSES